MLSALKRRILLALRQSLVPLLEEKCEAFHFPDEMTAREKDVFQEGFRKGFWQGATDSMTVGLDVLRKAAEEQAAQPVKKETPAYAEA